jgi:hypothetical protein
MAFVHVGGLAALRSSTTGASSFAGPAAVCPEQRPATPHTARPSRTATTMVVEDGEVSLAVGSQWKDRLGVSGGIPGGEVFYQKWIEDGMTGDFADMPARMQPSAEKKFTKKGNPVKSILAKIDAMEFIKGFEKKDADGSDVRANATSSNPASPEDIRAAVAAAIAADSQGADLEAPDEALYAPYFPAAVRNLAPEISLVCQRNVFTDRVSVAMTEVTAKATDVHFPKWYSGKAPVINIFYGSAATSGVSVSMDDIQAIPAYVAPSRPGLPDVALVAGTGGGLKINITPQ